jgi:hypothetical protein
MKKAVILILAIGTMATSCKKSYVCDCTGEGVEVNAQMYGEINEARIPKRAVEYNKAVCEDQGCLFYSK